MKLKTDDAKWMASPPAQRLMIDPWRGTAFTWPSTALMFVQCVPTVFPVFMGILGWSLPATSLFYFLSMTLHGLVWNTIHPAMHGLPDVPLAVGFPSSTMKFMNGSPIFEYLRLNHIGHHVASGRSNYNVCCPGMDHVVGTLMKQAEWEPKVRVNSRETRAIEGALTSEQM
jgi:sterol desaturase/sphingolipid hydroxylase (fatty acid hydroxylase superfamily)